jgi:hypothetical protein
MLVQKISKLSCPTKFSKGDLSLAECPGIRDILYFLQELKPPDGMGAKK